MGPPTEACHLEVNLRESVRAGTLNIWLCLDKRVARGSLDDNRQTASTLKAVFLIGYCFSLSLLL